MRSLTHHPQVKELFSAGISIPEDDYRLLTEGATERDIVYSGLEDTMALGVKETFQTAEKYQVLSLSSCSPNCEEISRRSRNWPFRGQERMMLRSHK